MTKGTFNEIYQDYVCSCVLRVAREIYAIIPDDLIIITAVDKLLNLKTGHKELDSWVERRVRCYIWKQWGRCGYRELIKRGVSRNLAWNMAKSAHGPWRLSRSPGLSFALTAKYFASLGLPQLHVKLT